MEVPMSAATEARIRKTPGVMGGEACIRSTRIPVWVLVGYRRLGTGDTRLLEFYPTLTQEDLDAAWEYHREHPAEIEEAIRRNEDDSGGD
jgi:uncharacterized protein (DUF433 family)